MEFFQCRSVAMPYRTYARGLIDNDETVSKVVSYAFADTNCKLKFKTTKGKFLGFSTKEEFLSLVCKLGDELMGEAFIRDAEDDELFY